MLKYHVPREDCTTRLFVAWFLISTAICAIYAIVVYASLVNKNVLPADPGPEYIPVTNVPIRYNVSLQFDSTHNKSVPLYSGSVNLLFVVRDTSNRIFIHAGSAIKMGKCSLRHDEGGDEVTVLKGVYNPKTEIQTLIPTQNLTFDAEYRLDIEFEGKLDVDSGPKTFYYNSEGREKRNGIWFSTPRAAPKGLRYLFPSMDASQFPALFDLTIRHKLTLRVLSNFKASTKFRPPHLVDYFHATARLYSTQVGLVLCDFPFQRQDVNGTEVSLYYHPSSLSNVNMRRLQQFMDKTSISIGKLDVVVVPGAPTVHLPGLSILNEQETVAENNAINGMLFYLLLIATVATGVTADGEKCESKADCPSGERCMKMSVMDMYGFCKKFESRFFGNGYRSAHFWHCLDDTECVGETVCIHGNCQLADDDFGKKLF